jgi:predicted metal-dependent enzyme (double-stranded beta helix superfamily)
MFDLEALIADCRTAVSDADPRGAIREVLARTVAKPDDVAAALGKDEGGISVLYNADDLTILNVIWAPKMCLFPHDHRMWAAIGIYGGAEANTLYRRGEERLQPAGGRMLDVGDVFGLGADAIHSVDNPRTVFTGAIHIYGGAEANTLYRRGEERLQPAGGRMLDVGDVFGLGADAIHSVDNPRTVFTGAIHIYGGDFVNQPRSQWDPDTLLEEPYDVEMVRQRFAQANEDWRQQLGTDLDETTT